MIAQANVGNPPEKRVHKVYADLQKRLKKLACDYVEQKRDMENFLKTVGRNLQVST